MQGECGGLIEAGKEQGTPSSRVGVGDSVKREGVGDYSSGVGQGTISICKVDWMWVTKSSRAGALNASAFS